MSGVTIIKNATYYFTEWKGEPAPELRYAFVVKAVLPCPYCGNREIFSQISWLRPWERRKPNKRDIMMFLEMKIPNATPLYPKSARKISCNNKKCGKEIEFFYAGDCQLRKAKDKVYIEKHLTEEIGEEERNEKTQARYNEN